MQRALTSVLPRSSRLRVLDVSANHLASLPAQIRHLENLEYLLAGDNDLEELPKQVPHPSHALSPWCAVQFCIKFCLSCQSLHTASTVYVLHTVRIPRQVRHLSKLVVLALGKNRLREVPEQIKSAAPTLRTLDLSANRLTSFPPAVLHPPQPTSRQRD